MLSYWETESFLKYDFIIVGSGITGLSTAIELKEKFPGKSVLVLERGLFPTGASTRNAGFACLGSVTELLDDLDNLPPDKVLELYEWRKYGLIKLRKRLGDSSLSYAENGSFELISEEDTAALDKINLLNSLLKSTSPKPVFSLANDQIHKFGFSKKHVSALIENKGEGELNTGKMMRSLLDLASKNGIEIKTGASVEGYTQLNNKVLVQVMNSMAAEEIPFQAGKLILCTNAFTSALVEGVELKPGRGQVLITGPVKGLKFKGIFHFDKGYYYFREINGRVLIGGGRNLDFEGEKSVEFALNTKIQASLENKLREVILPDTNFEIEQKWSGIMAFGPDKFPAIQQVSPNVFGAFRLGGMGIALASTTAEKVVELIIQTE